MRRGTLHRGRETAWSPRSHDTKWGTLEPLRTPCQQALAQFMIPLPYLTLHRIGGADAEAFLQAQLAADVASLGVGAAGFAAWCSPRGQVIALFLVLRETDAWVLACESRLAVTVFDRLRRYILRSRVEFEALDGLILAGLPDAEQAPSGMAVFQSRQPGLCYVLLGREANPPESPGPSERAAWWQAVELRHGIAWLAPATSERFIPQMLGLDEIGAVSFAKGCYPGQEVVARTRYLGQVKRKPVLVEVEGRVPGDAGEPCTVVSAGESVEGVLVEALAVETTDGQASAARGPTTLALIVAPLADTAGVSAVEAAGSTWPARRLKPVTAA